MLDLNKLQSHLPGIKTILEGELSQKEVSLASCTIKAQEAHWRTMIHDLKVKIENIESLITFVAEEQTKLLKEKEEKEKEEKAKVEKLKLETKLEDDSKKKSSSKK